MAVIKKAWFKSCRSQSGYILVSLVKIDISSACLDFVCNINSNMLPYENAIFQCNSIGCVLNFQDLEMKHYNHMKDAMYDFILLTEKWRDDDSVINSGFVRGG